MLRRWIRGVYRSLAKTADRGDRTPDLPLTKRLPCHLAISALHAPTEVTHRIQPVSSGREWMYVWTQSYKHPAHVHTRTPEVPFQKGANQGGD
jgi:hypothetical protein